MKNVTITDIAKASGVSIKTVSRVLNGEANVRDQMRKKVKATAKSLGYRPNISARMLRSQRSYVIAHFHDNPNADYLENVYKGVQTVSREEGYFAVMEPLKPPYAKQAAAYLEKFKIDGVILSPPLSDDSDLLELLETESIPFVRISPRFDRERSSSSSINDEDAAKTMTHVLIDLGHTNIAFINGPADHGASRLRQRGFEAALNDAGLSAKECPVIRGDFSVRSGFEISETLLAEPGSISAIFAANDDMAVGAVMAALKAGLDIPSDLSIAGFDGSRLGEMIWPKLTTVFQPIEKMAASVAQSLLQEITQPEAEKTYKKFDTDILLRSTIGPRQ